MIKILTPGLQNRILVPAPNFPTNNPVPWGEMPQGRTQKTERQAVRPQDASSAGAVRATLSSATGLHSSLDSSQCLEIGTIIGVLRDVSTESLATVYNGFCTLEKKFVSSLRSWRYNWLEPRKGTHRTRDPRKRAAKVRVRDLSQLYKPPGTQDSLSRMSFGPVMQSFLKRRVQDSWRLAILDFIKGGLRSI